VEVINEIYIVARRAICRVLPFDFIWYRFIYILKAKFIEAIINTAYTISGHLRGISESSPEVKTLYIQVEKVSTESFHKGKF
jgi:hypothetical protein